MVLPVDPLGVQRRVNMVFQQSIVEVVSRSLNVDNQIEIAAYI